MPEASWSPGFRRQQGGGPGGGQLGGQACRDLQGHVLPRCTRARGPAGGPTQGDAQGQVTQSSGGGGGALRLSPSSSANPVPPRFPGAPQHTLPMGHRLSLLGRR